MSIERTSEQEKKNKNLLTRDRGEKDEKKMYFGGGCGADFAKDVHFVSRAWPVTSRCAFTNLHRAPTLAAPPLSWRRLHTHARTYTPIHTYTHVCAARAQ